MEEALSVTKLDAVTDRVRVRTAVETRDVVVEEVLARGMLEVARTRVDREVGEAPPPRHEGDLLILSVVEERLVKRLFVIEEVRVRQTTTRETICLPATLRTMRATVEQGEDPPAGGTI